MQFDLDAIREVLILRVDHHVPAGDEEQALVTGEEKAAGIGQLPPLIEGAQAGCGKQQRFDDHAVLGLSRLAGAATRGWRAERVALSVIGQAYATRCMPDRRIIKLCMGDANMAQGYPTREQVIDYLCQHGQRCKFPRAVHRRWAV
jgi:hypothetical protein